MNTVDLLRRQFAAAHATLASVLADAAPVAHVVPPGLPSTIAAQYLHILLSEDLFIQTLAGGLPLAETTFAGKIGAEPPPHVFDWADWGRSVTVDLAAAADYGAAVFAQTDDYLAGLSPADIAAVVDLSVFELGELTRGEALTVMLENCYVHSGEIACLKGIHGLRGYTV